MRNESVDETEILRRMEEGIYDHEEYAKAMAWTDKYCKTKEGWDKNRPTAENPGAERCRLGVCGEDDPYRARLDERQSPAS